MANQTDVKTNQFQSVYIKLEASGSFGAGDTDYSTSGIQLRTREMVPFENITRELIADRTIRTSWDDVGAPLPRVA